MISTGALPRNVAPAWGSSGKGQRVGGIAGAAHHRSRNSFLGTLIIGRQGRSKPLYKCRRNPRATHGTRWSVFLAAPQEKLCPSPFFLRYRLSGEMKFF
ncbi:hypothetical protein TNIN_377511 [Trichonephila inaurata madagascariensis]|uniref:Uncharacterized protein n=1 Tax=Trichonephila inaurata madagascariensis TaxID=2747483 RepID=A0A8X6YBW3_9ARAC|nr:hypothetical protein TNIN_377511 [Trichonephila inaurata madagascariensis]